MGPSLFPLPISGSVDFYDQKIGSFRKESVVGEAGSGSMDPSMEALWPSSERGASSYFVGILERTKVYSIQ